MPEERTTLTADQQRVLAKIYERFYESGTWPTFGEIDRPVRKLGLHPDQIIEDLASEGILLPFQADCGRSVGTSCASPSRAWHTARVPSRMSLGCSGCCRGWR